MKKKEIPDNKTDPSDRNEELRRHLNGVWADFDIASIERMEKQDTPGPVAGWRVLYRED